MRFVNYANDYFFHYSKATSSQESHSLSQTEMFGQFKKRMSITFLVLLMIVVGSSSAVAQSELYPNVPPFDGIRYGLAYDSSVQGPAKSAQICINFDADKTFAEGSRSRNSIKETVTTSSELSDKMGLTIMAQVASLDGNYEVDTKLDIMNKSTASEFSETKLFYTYDKTAKVFLDGALSLKPEFQALLENGIQGEDEFRAKCGNGFVIALQRGSYYLGTAFQYKQKTSAANITEFNFDFSLTNGSAKYGATLDLIKENIKEASKEEEKLEVDTSSDLEPPSNVTEMEKKWKEFAADESDAEVVNALVAPYSVVQGSLPKGLLFTNIERQKLRVLLNALWDLKALKDEAFFILSNPDQYALGLPEGPSCPGCGAKREINLEWVRSLNDRWRNEFIKLLKDTKSCLENFKRKGCNSLANWYDSHPRNTERKLLPKRYKSRCYDDYHVTPESIGGNFPIDGSIRGDDEMGGGPVKVTSKLYVKPNDRELIMEWLVELEENKSDHSTFQGIHEVPIFTLTPQFPGLQDVFKECEYAKSPISINPINGTLYASVDKLSQKDPRDFRSFAGRGMFDRIFCKVDTPGDDRKETACKYPNLKNFRVLLVNSLDVNAEKAVFPQLEPAPSKFTFMSPITVDPDRWNSWNSWNHAGGGTPF